MERLYFDFDGGRDVPPGAPCIVGVLGSGNLEVLVESTGESGRCAIEVNTASAGFARIWKAVLADFFERHRAGSLRILVNDAGATPATVALRLDQALEAFAKPRKS